jgi:hypothetical protein
LLCFGSYGMNLGMGHHSRLEVMAFYQGAVALMGFFYSLNVPGVRHRPQTYQET